MAYFLAKLVNSSRSYEQKLLTRLQIITHVYSAYSKGSPFKYFTIILGARGFWGNAHFAYYAGAEFGLTLLV